MNRSIITAGFLALAGCLSLGAQSIRLQATIPFEFRAGEQLLPAGEYMITHSSGVLTFRGQAGPKKGAILLVHGTQNGSNGARNKLVFNRYGDDYFLSRVWQAGGDTGLVVTPGKIEKEMIAGRGTQVQTASVNLRGR